MPEVSAQGKPLPQRNNPKAAAKQKQQQLPQQKNKYVKRKSNKQNNRPSFNTSQNNKHNTTLVSSTRVAKPAYKEILSKGERHSVGVEDDASRHMAWRRIKYVNNKPGGAYIECRFITPFASRIDHSLFLFRAPNAADPSLIDTTALTLNLQCSALPRDIFSDKHSTETRREAYGVLKGILEKAFELYLQKLDLVSANPAKAFDRSLNAGRIIKIVSES